MADNSEPPQSASATTAPEADNNTTDMTAQDRLAELIAQATAAYAVKDYSPAAEFYSQATEIQAELNGEMAIENADLLYSYGKCLYFVAVRNSEVLGVGSTGSKLGNKNSEPEAKSTKKRKADGSSAKPSESLTSVVAANGEGSKSSSSSDTVPGLDLLAQKQESESKASGKPYFQFQGDDNYDVSDSDEEGEESAGDGQDGGDEEEEEQDDFSLAFEVLDLSRVLLLRKLAALEQTSSPSSKGKGKSKSSTIPPEIFSLKERIADVHDLQAEISLEGERYNAAITDFRSSLSLLQDIYPSDSNFIAECHYKLSLALEFASKTQQRDGEGNPIGDATIDEEMRAEAASEMESAIASCRARLAKEEAALQAIGETGSSAKHDKAQKEIGEVREMVEELEQRLVDLRAAPVDAVQEASRQSEIEIQASLGGDGGVLRKILEASASKEETRRKLEEVSGQARDLTGMVRRKKPKQQQQLGDGTAATGSGPVSASATPEPSAISTPTTTTTTPTINGGAATIKGKRKVAFSIDDVDEADIPLPAEKETNKRVRMEEVEDSGT